MEVEPKLYRAIMLSSTFTDLEAHRREVIDAIHRLGFHVNAIEYRGAFSDADIIDTSLRMVRDSVAYLCVIGHKYGQSPADPDRNPDGLSITELELNEARRLGKPILLFLMADDHPVTKGDVEPDWTKARKLEAFRKRAKRIDPDKPAERVYETFASVDEFARKAAIAIGLEGIRMAGGSNLPDRAIRDAIARFIDVKPEATEAELAEAIERFEAAYREAAMLAKPPVQEPPRPAAPALRALPPYVGSHDFTGQAAELDMIDDWASPEDPHPVLLLEAMGGAGKSMLAWHWLKERAPRVRGDWAGRFWYSFYAQGAGLTGFCHEALSYMTGQPAETFAGMSAAEWGGRLLAELDRRPWLLVLDGLERILVAYHRFDDAERSDEDIESLGQPPADRDPRRAIRPEDDEFLERLAAVTRSKLLVSTRIAPAKFVDRSGLPIPGIRREFLAGLRPADAEAMFRASGIRGDSQAMQSFLQTNCGGNPLVIGALAGLVNDYPPDRANFDAWLNDPAYGGALNLGDLGLTERRNHILRAAMAALPPEGRQLLGIVSRFADGTNYARLERLNPHLPRKPTKVNPPEEPTKDGSLWAREEIDREGRRFDEGLAAYSRYVEALRKWRADPAVTAAPRKLSSTVRDLEARGLLQYDASTRKFDLHPIVRTLASRLDDIDEQRIQEILEQGDDSDAANVVAEPDASAIVQNPLAVTFEPDDQGRIGISSEVDTDRLLDDADSRDRHSEVLREARAALNASRHGATQASDMASPIADYIEALGAALLDIRASLLILRGEKLRRLIAARAGPDSFAAPLSEDQAAALEAWRIAHNLLVGLDPYLTRIERATYDPDTPIVSINIGAMHVVIEAVELADIATEDASSALKDSVENIPTGAPAEDRRAKSAMENLANFARAIVKVVKFGWRAGAAGAKLSGDAWKLAKFVKSNISWLDQVFAGYRKVLDILHWVASLLP